MKILLASLAMTLAVAAALTMGWYESGAAADDGPSIERGAYIVRSAGCHDCHTPWHMGPGGPEPDMSRMLSGHPADFAIAEPATLPEGPWLVAVTGTNTAWSGPWGVSFTRNLTPHPKTGIGSWSPEEFLATLRSMRHRGLGRALLPPMPNVYGNLSDEDIRSVYLYLQSIPAIDNRVPDPLPPR